MKTNYLTQESAINSYLLEFNLNRSESDLRTFHLINPNRKLVYFINSTIPIEDVQNFLQFAWNTYKIMNILMIRPDNINPTIFYWNPFESRLFQSNKTSINSNLLISLKNIRKNLNGYPMRVYIFEYPVISQPIRDKMGKILRFKYLDGAILNFLSEKMNFTPIFHKILDNVTYGFRYQNGTFTGALKALENNYVDIAANTRTIFQMETKNVIFLRPLEQIHIVFMVPKSEHRTHISLFIYNAYDCQSRLWMLITFIAFIIAWSALDYIYYCIIQRQTRRRQQQQIVVSSFGRNILIVVSVQHIVSVNFHRELRSYERILLICLLVYALIITNLFQGNIVKQLSTAKSDDINTLERLAKSSMRIKAVATTENYLCGSEKDDQTSIMGRLLMKQDTIFTLLDEAAKNMIHNKSYALVVPKQFAEYYNAKLYNPTTGHDLIHIIPESVTDFYTSFLTVKNSPFVVQFNDILLQLLESGLIDCERRKIDEELKCLKSQRSKHTFQYEEKYKSISFVEFKSLVTLLGIGHIISAIVFWFEILIRGRCFY